MLNDGTQPPIESINLHPDPEAENRLRVRKLKPFDVPIKYQISGVTCNDNLKNAIAGKDIICTDSIPSDTIEDFKNHQVNTDLMNLAKDKAVLNPCPPFYRGEEVSADVIDSDFFVGYEFKNSLLKIQQAIIIYCLSN